MLPRSRLVHELQCVSRIVTVDLHVLVLCLNGRWKGRPKAQKKAKNNPKNVWLSRTTSDFHYGCPKEAKEAKEGRANHDFEFFRQQPQNIYRHSIPVVSSTTAVCGVWVSGLSLCLSTNSE
jgi:hypothetical protein